MNKITYPFSHSLFKQFPKTNNYENYELEMVKSINTKLDMYKEKYPNIRKLDIIADYKHCMDFDSYRFLLNNMDRLLIYDDIEDLSFAVLVDPRIDAIKIIHPHMIYDEDFYAGFNPSEFMSKSAYDKILWMNDNMDFIPFNLLEEDFNDRKSHRLSHIMKDNEASNKIKRFMDNSEFNLNRSAYYYIMYNKSHDYYLKRDIDLSPYTK